MPQKNGTMVSRPNSRRSGRELRQMAAEPG